MSVSVVSCVYGAHARLVPAWLEAVRVLDPAPAEVIVASDQPLGSSANVMSLYGACLWKHPQAFYLNLAISAAQTDWVWIADVDDRPFPDALAGLAEVWTDVWQMGFFDGEREYVVPQMTAAEYLQQPGNPFVGSSAIRVDAFRKAGGFQDVAFQDWALWRKLARAGASFQSSGRTHFHYNLHQDARTAVELTADRRAEHTAEMYASEGFVVA